MSDDMDKIHEMAVELDNARSEKKRLEEELKSTNEKIKQIEETGLAPALEEIGISDVTMDDMKISKSYVFRAPCTKSDDPETFQYLFDTNNDGAMKKHLIVDLSAYPRTPFELDLLDIKYEYEYSIHHATLSSIIKELVMSGEFTTDDIERYRVYVQPQIKITKKK